MTTRGLFAFGPLLEKTARASVSWLEGLPSKGGGLGLPGGAGPSPRRPPARRRRPRGGPGRLR